MAPGGGGSGSDCSVAGGVASRCWVSCSVPFVVGLGGARRGRASSLVSCGEGISVDLGYGGVVGVPGR